MIVSRESRERLCKYELSNTALLLMLAMALFSTTAISKSFTAELMLKNESLGEVRFSPNGERVYFDRHLPYREKLRFDLERDWNRSLSILMTADVLGGSIMQLRNSPHDRTWYLSTSPDGRYLVFGWLDHGVQRLGLLDQRMDRERRLPISSTTTVGTTLKWLSDTVFIVESQEALQQERSMALGSYEARMVAGLAEKAWRGHEASVKVVGSGRYQSKPNAESVKVIRVDAATGNYEVLDEGAIWRAYAVAPVGRRIAWLRKVGLFGAVNDTVEGVYGLQSIDELVVYDDLTQSYVVVPSCKKCSIDRGTLRWSPSGSQLYFSARYRQGSGFAHRHFIYDVNRRSTSQLQVQGLSFDTEGDVRHGNLYPPLLWLDDGHFAVRTRDAKAGEFGLQGFRWHLIRKNGAVIRDLTANLPRGDDKQAFRSPVAVYHGALLMLAAGNLWRLPQRGAAENLTQGLGVEVESWCAPFAPWRVVKPNCDALGPDNIIPRVDPAALRKGRIVLRAMHGDTFSGEFIFLDLETGGITRVQRPSGNAEPLGASALAEAAMFLHEGTGSDELMLVRADGSIRFLYRFNTHLAGIEGAKPVLLTRRELGENEDRNDWLLLPPDHKPGQRHPLLVYFYPDTRYGKELRGEDLREVSFLNMSLPAAHGYAVLLVSMKISDFGTAGGNPMKEMHGQLIRAAENAVAKGYVDSERWAIMGHSYGGYGVNCVVTQTGRFRAAISMASLSNLTSAYAIGMNYTKATMVPEELYFGATWAEGGGGRMGVPPWRNPQRYIDNSPLFSAESIVTPLMLIHGDLDLVNVNEAEQFFTALHRQGKDVVLVRYWGEGHFILSPANIIDMWERIFAFLDENIGSSSADQAR